MIKCSDCGASQYEGTLFCGECGRFLAETAKQITAVLPFSQFVHPSPPPSLEDHTLITASEPQQIMFVIPSGRHRFAIELVDQIRVGRGDPETGLLPELNLADYDGAARGISRIHATIQLSNYGIVIIDMGSTNGTLLNNYRLHAQKPYLLQNGDEVRFGDLLIHVFFEEASS